MRGLAEGGASGRGRQQWPEWDATDHQILDAVRELVGQLGPDKLTVDDIAARASIARITVFRRFGSKANVINQAIQREQFQLLRQFEAATDSIGGVRGCLVELFMLTIQSARTSPIFRRLTVSEPQSLLVEYAGRGNPSPWSFIRAYLAMFIEARALEEGIECREPRLVADILAHQIVSYALLPTSVDLDNPPELRHLANVVVASLV
ncbi:TetR/AcrR family transcriptional regulator [Mycobacteroides abscessus]|uniref:TetR/AcrR family transcriptional regulator n=1 Tax=Mycobacteroides abscessus TaxID=36809 RepID=UPI000929F90F|nr:TetR/AcrR family transcriptional regulator [Mycobacteroides abscessus]SHQ88993.1 Putative TetR-family transcriptional regulator [Mycobacteroides abscessus subsp. bolletii]SHR74011.1 Putative TetR-family transcriptional regulator [Mycobacteroides abscessus subsp. bolletii]SHT17295.1 Putative TetR-family transcriptional regulator [Mycobacteroides abscessus subsp. bolletii]SKG05367.1 Putative TetR-family transcriptional regulator [Mycobacteroides abscessus subsp. bolletii]SKG72226.1 Putative T